MSKIFEMDVKEPLAGKSSSEGSSSKVQFVSSSTEEKNGEAKIAIGAYDTIKVGLNKEELMKYANDPFWVKIRMISFILFWVAWWATLAISTAIVFRAPRCPLEVVQSNGAITTTLASTVEVSSLSPISTTLAAFTTSNPLP